MKKHGVTVKTPGRRQVILFDIREPSRLPLENARLLKVGYINGGMIRPSKHNQTIHFGGDAECINVRAGRCADSPRLGDPTVRPVKFILPQARRVLIWRRLRDGSDKAAISWDAKGAQA